MRSIFCNCLFSKTVRLRGMVSQVLNVLGQGAGDEQIYRF